MAVGKALYKSCVLRGDLDPASITATANREISRDNSEMLFITFFAGLLDLETGLLHFCNAGHDPPYAALPGEAPRQIDRQRRPAALRHRGISLTRPFISAATRRAFVPGHDGVTEAWTNRARCSAMRRCWRAWRHCRKISAPQMRCGIARHRRVVRRAGRSVDDLTALTVRWHGARV